MSNGLCSNERDDDVIILLSLVSVNSCHLRSIATQIKQFQNHGMLLCKPLRYKRSHHHDWYRFTLYRIIVTSVYLIWVDRDIRLPYMHLLWYRFTLYGFIVIWVYLIWVYRDIGLPYIGLYWHRFTLYRFIEIEDYLIWVDRDIGLPYMGL